MLRDLLRSPFKTKDTQEASATVSGMQKMKVYSFVDGTETLPRAIEAKIRQSNNTDILLNTGVERIDQVDPLLSGNTRLASVLNVEANNSKLMAQCRCN